MGTPSRLHARCGVLCTFRIDTDGANPGSGNRSRNRLDMIGSHDSGADNSYPEPLVFRHTVKINIAFAKSKIKGRLEGRSLFDELRICGADEEPGFRPLQRKCRLGARRPRNYPRSDHGF